MAECNFDNETELNSNGYDNVDFEERKKEPVRTKAPKGTRDILPADVFKWHTIERKMRDLAALYGYREIRTPVFEHTELFLRSVGDTSDIVQKEMYTFTDKGGRSITLKPEGTAGAARAVVEHRLYAEALPVKMYYINSPIYRYDKPQAGRLREHHQFGVEVFGAREPTCDAEVIMLAWTVLKRVGITGLTLKVNSIGCPKCRAAYNESLHIFLTSAFNGLCQTCQTRYATNPMRILDCKDVDCQSMLAGAPSILDFLCTECGDHFDDLKEALEALHLPFEVDPHIVRGLDYYTRTVFEILPETSNVPIAVCAGGRYDGLVETVGGPSLPGLGFGMGMERVLMLLDMQQDEVIQPRQCDVFVCSLPDARLQALKVTQALRVARIRADCDHTDRSLKGQYKYANKLDAVLTVFVGGEELERGVVKIRNMDGGEETEVALAEAASTVRSMLGM